jgi:hypothetical protein
LPADAPFFLCTTLLVQPLGSLGSIYIGSGRMKNHPNRTNKLDLYQYIQFISNNPGNYQNPLELHTLNIVTILKNIILTFFPNTETTVALNHKNLLNINIGNACTIQM